MTNMEPDNTTLKPVTIERISAIFDAQGFNYQINEGHIQTGFGDVPMQVQIEADGSFLLFRAMWHSCLSEQNAAIANSHIAQRHRTTFFPTFYTVRDEEGYQVVADVCLFVGRPEFEGDIENGVTDAQLYSYFGVFEMLEQEITELSASVNADIK